MTQQIAVRIPDDDLRSLDASVSAGRYATRAAAIRAALQLLLRLERERVIADEYRRAYGAPPQEEWIGEAGLSLGAQLIAAEAPPERS